MKRISKSILLAALICSGVTQSPIVRAESIDVKEWARFRNIAASVQRHLFSICYSALNTRAPIVCGQPIQNLSSAFKLELNVIWVDQNELGDLLFKFSDDKSTIRVNKTVWDDLNSSTKNAQSLVRSTFHAFSYLGLFDDSPQDYTYTDSILRTLVENKVDIEELSKVGHEPLPNILPHFREGRYTSLDGDDFSCPVEAVWDPLTNAVYSRELRVSSECNGTRWIEFACKPGKYKDEMGALCSVPNTGTYLYFYRNIVNMMYLVRRGEAFPYFHTRSRR